ncbi:MAG: zinc-dependent metalloprotease [Bacteroidota bacterium]
MKLHHLFRSSFQLLFALLFITGFSGALLAQTIQDKVGDTPLSEGFFDYYYDQDQDKIWLKVDKLGHEFLYANYLAAGVGSNDIGLDRSQQGGERVVYFEKRGSKLMLIQPNLRYVARSENELEKKSVREAFASSVIFGFPVEAEQDGAYLIDLSPFLMRDAHGVTDRLRGMREGNYSLDKSRSSLYAEGTFNFPLNSEFETLLTFTGSNPGRELRSVVPDPSAITVRQHHSFVALPDDNYTPRAYDPRAGYYPTTFMDYAAPIEEDMAVRYINRHRLEKKDPNAELSEAVEPIVYYLDNGTPEPVRSALLDGARWWNQAFEAAGYKDAFQVKVLPDAAHPLDIRYNVINWVHRSTRGWSYGGSVVDPRTGEIIKGNVLLGSLRVRQDFMIATGLLAPFSEESMEGMDDLSNSPMMDMALARIRQLSAHEVGHTLGIYHNFASSVNNRASVMDYPHPKVDIIDGALDLDDAYDVGIGEWDKATIAYGYQDFPEGTDEKQALNEILEQARRDGLDYISDNDARPQSGSHPTAHLWDYGQNPVQQLDHILEVREVALDQFGLANIPEGRPLTYLEDVLVPIYFFHRYQVEGTVKMIGGMEYSYKLKGDNQRTPRIVLASVQREALQGVLKTLEPEVLALPESLLDLIPPRPAGLVSTRELFSGRTGPSLDAMSIAQSSANMTLGLLLNPERANRLVEYGARANNLSLQETIDALLTVTWGKEEEAGYLGSIQEVVNYEVVRHLIALHASDRSSPLTKAIVLDKLSSLKNIMEGFMRPMAGQGAFMIEQYMHNPSSFEASGALSVPPGSPIGSGWMEYCSTDF